MKEKLDVCMASCVEGEGGRVRLNGLQGASPFLLNLLSSAHIFINSQVINPWITPCVCSLFPIGTDAEMWSLYSGAKSNLRDRVLGEVEKNSFIALPGKGGHSRLMPSKLCVPTGGGISGL